MAIQLGHLTTPSSTHGPFTLKKALIDARQESYFGQLSDVVNMPKHHGKELRAFHLVPIIDERNYNDQGLDATGAKIVEGNLYGSKKDIGNVINKLPALQEEGGRVNRVGFTRQEINGSMENFGFFFEYSEDLLNFDTQEDLEEHFSRELLNAAMKVHEDALQADLLNYAGVVRYAGGATSTQAISDVMTYEGLVKLSIELDKNKCPKQTKVITGSRMIDTKTIPACRVAFVGSELIPLLESMKNFHDQPAFIGVEQYAAGTTVLNGERGRIGDFRIVVVPNMLHKSHDNKTVHPFLVVGSESFTQIGFETDGKQMKFKTYSKKPGQDSVSHSDPYGKKGLQSIQWYYGFMPLRPERIAVFWTLDHKPTP